MTAAQPGELREALAGALYGRNYAAEFTTWEELHNRIRQVWLADADAVLPVVTAYAERLARARAAEELRAVARTPEAHTAHVTPLWLLNRADALTAEPVQPEHYADQRNLGIEPGDRP